MTIEVDLYQKIRHLHEHEKMSQRAIAKMLGVSRNTVKKYYGVAVIPARVRKLQVYLQNQQNCLSIQPANSMKLKIIS